MGALLPRDFLERQPKRWQKSQRKRRVLGTLRKMKTKREKLEQRTYDHLQRDAGLLGPRKGSSRQAESPAGVLDPREGSTRQREPPAAPPLATKQKAAPSHSTPIGSHASGLWAAELMPYQPLVVRIPEGVELFLHRASLKAAGSADGADSASSTVRCRTPSVQQPTTLCVLQPQLAETCGLNVRFRAADRSCAIAVEGPDAVHVVGCYVRPDAEGSTDAPSPPPEPSQQRAQRAAPEQTREAPAAAAPAAAAPAAAPAGGGAPRLVELSDGLKYADVKKGGGRRAARGNRLTVKYTGLAPDRRAAGGWSEFDSNGGKALHFVLGDGEMIRGWDVGLVGMRQGGTRRLVVPPAMGYGERGAGPVPGGATLIFEIMLLNVI